MDMTEDYTMVNSNNNLTHLVDTNKSSTIVGLPPVWKLALMYLIATVILLVNIPVFLIVPRLQTLHISMRFIMLNLAITDFSLGLLTHTRLLYYCIMGTSHLPDTFCRLDAFMNNLLGSLSILSLTFLSLDKLLTLKYPLSYGIKMTKLKTCAILSAMWTLMVILYIPTVAPALGGKASFNHYSYACLVDTQAILAYLITILLLLQVIPSILLLVSTTSICCLVHQQRELFQQYLLEEQKYNRETQVLTTILIMTCMSLLFSY